MRTEKKAAEANADLESNELLSQAELGRKIHALKEEISQLHADLREKHVHDPNTGQRLTTQQYFDWKEKKRSLLTQKIKEATRLRLMSRNKGLVSKRAKITGLEQASQLLWRCSQVLRRLEAEGVELSSDERKLLTDVAGFIGLKQSEPIDQVRALVGGGSTNIFHLGSMIALATRDEKDLAVLVEEWKKINAIQPRNNELMATCAQEYIDALCTYGRFAEAISVARSLDPAQMNTAYAWLNIAQHSDDERLFAYVRELGRSAEGPRRPWLFLALYRLTGDIEDAKMTTFSFTEGSLILGKKARWHDVLLVKDHTMWQRLEEAREVYTGIQTAEERMQALSYIAEFSEDPKDLEQLTAMLALHIPIRVHTVVRLATVLAQNDRGEAVAKMLDAMSAWHLRCAGYSVLARFMNDRVVEMLDRAEQVVTSAKVTNTTEGAHALFSLVYAQAINGRTAEAMHTIEIIQEQESRGMALLLVHLLSREEPLPDFLKDRL